MYLGAPQLKQIVHNTDFYFYFIYGRTISTTSYYCLSLFYLCQFIIGVRWDCSAITGSVAQRRINVQLRLERLFEWLGGGWKTFLYGDFKD